MSFLPILALPVFVSASTIALADGVCRFLHGAVVVFQGHCTAKQKVRGSKTVVLINLENGSTF